MRDAQSLHISDVRERCAELGIPVLNIDTRKKELIGNFQREGRVICTTMLKWTKSENAPF